jgi:hypothetical protein
MSAIHIALICHPFRAINYVTPSILLKSLNRASQNTCSEFTEVNITPFSTSISYFLFQTLSLQSQIQENV